MMHDDDDATETTEFIQAEFTHEEPLEQTKPSLGSGGGISRNDEFDGLPKAAPIAQVLAFGNGVKSFLVRVNPFEDLNNSSEARTAIWKEANLFFDPASFSQPTDRAEWLDRLNSNSRRFKLSYSLIFLFTFAWFFLTSPILLLEIGILVALWVLFFRFNG
jgi:hypothetical protein